MAETVVKIDNLVKRYKELIALDHFDLEIKKGEVFGLLGPCLLYTSPSPRDTR